MKNKIESIRHSISHLMSMAVLEIYPKAGLGVGPSIENGFYQDYGLPESISESILPQLEKRMREMIKEKINFQKHQVNFEEALKFYRHDPYKREIIRDLKKAGEKNVSFYKSGWFDNLCAGPHVKSTKEINPDAFKLTKIAGAYWRGSEKNPMLQRIYGVAFETKKELDEYLKQIEEAEKRDHRLIGQKLDLFSIDEEVGPGLVLWHPKGATLKGVIENFWVNEHIRNGYEIVDTPHIGRIKLWQTSGHTGFYKENMFGPMEVEGDQYLIKPMNCPFHMKIYKTQTRSYRDLPIRWAELGTVYRFERSGVLHGLTRVRGFTQDDAHIICTPDQLADEVMTAVKFGIKLLKDFGFKEYGIYLATRPEKYVGTPKNWEKATITLKNALNKLKLKYEIDEGGGVFYGPKIDIKIKDAIGREWQCTTVQFDFNLPERFDLVYIDDKGKKQRPYMVHRALLGSIERFVGVLLEHYAGVLPFWLSPVQIKILPIGKNHKAFAQKTKQIFIDNGFRVKVDDSDDTIGKRIREAEMQKIPYIIVIGDKEMSSKTLAVRSRGKKDIETINIDKFIENIKRELK